MAVRGRENDNWKNLPYFHDNFKSTEDVAQFIKKKAKGKAGSFLFRPSNRDRNMLTASVLVPDKSVRHTHVQIEPDITRGGYKYFLVAEKKFDYIDDLVNYYRENPVKNLENVNNVYFQNPIYRSDINANFYAEQNGSNGSRGMAERTRSMSSLHSQRSNQSFGSESVNGPPPLPVRPYTRSGSSDGSSFTDSSGSQVNPLPNSDLANRPPLPLPVAIHPSAGAEYNYSRARDVTEDMSEKLKDVLKSSERCECGIPRSLAELPMGWTVHLSKDPLTRGKLFYQNEAGVTSWALPPAVQMQLTRVHINNLRQIDENWHLRRKTVNAQNF